MYASAARREESEMDMLLKDVFWSLIRADIYNKIWKGKGGQTQWAFISGKKSRDKAGQRIRLTDKNMRILQRAVDYLNKTDGLNQLLSLGIKEPPECVDDLIEILANSKTRVQTKKEEFQIFIRNREKIMRFLSKM